MRNEDGHIKSQVPIYATVEATPVLEFRPTGNPAVNLPAATFTQIQPSSRNLSGKVPVVDDVTTDAVIEYANSDIEADGR